MSDALARFLAMCYNNCSTEQKGRKMIPEVVDTAKEVLARSHVPMAERMLAMLVSQADDSNGVGSCLFPDLDIHVERIIDALFARTHGTAYSLFLMRASEWRMRNKALEAIGFDRDDRLMIPVAKCSSCQINIGYAHHEHLVTFVAYETKKVRTGARRVSTIKTQPIILCRECTRRRMMRDEVFVDRVTQAARGILKHDAYSDDVLFRAVLLALRDDRTIDIYATSYDIFDAASLQFHQFVSNMTGISYRNDIDCLSVLDDQAYRYITAFQSYLEHSYQSFLSNHEERHEQTKRPSVPKRSGSTNKKAN